MEPDRNSDPLKHLEERIEAAKQAQEGGPKTEEHYSAAQVGWRMVTELVAGLGIGFGIGYGLDMAIGTAPFMMLIFTLLGFHGGRQNDDAIRQRDPRRNYGRICSPR